MNVEIERKFIVINDDWKLVTRATHSILQVYLSNQNNATVRVRIVNGDAAWLTIKGPRANNTALEFEYEIPVEDAQHLALLSTTPSITKYRNVVCDQHQQVWEVDQFVIDGQILLTMAEIEINAVDQKVELPSWVGMEVSSDPKYNNVNIANWLRYAKSPIHSTL